MTTFYTEISVPLLFCLFCGWRLLPHTNLKQFLSDLGEGLQRRAWHIGGAVLDFCWTYKPFCFHDLYFPFNYFIKTRDNSNSGDNCFSTQQDNRGWRNGVLLFRGHTYRNVSYGSIKIFWNWNQKNRHKRAKLKFTLSLKLLASRIPSLYD